MYSCFQQLLLSVVWCLVEVHSQTFPYVSFMGQTLANHSYVDLSLVGVDDSGSDSVQCLTDLTTCCTSAQGSHRGDWYFPNGDTLPFGGNGDIYKHRDRDNQRVDIRRKYSPTSPVGIYRCDIPTIAVHDNDDISVRATVYVGLYTANGGKINNKYFIIHLIRNQILGDISISGGVTLSVDSDLNGRSPQFILTCISTDGPATTVTWSRDSTTVTKGNETVLNDPVTAQYTHTLTVTGRLPGLYTCILANNKPSNRTATFTVQGELENTVLLLNGLFCSSSCLSTN